MPANDAPAAGSPSQEAVAPAAQPSAAQAREPEGKAPVSASDKRTIRTICIITAVIVLIIAVVTACLLFLNANKHRGVSIQVGIDIAGTNVESTSGVPLRIQGTDFENNTVNENVLVTSDDFSIDLERGTYTLSVVGDPVSDSGELFATTTTSIPVEIDEETVRIDGQAQDASPKNDSNDSPSLNIGFEPVPLKDVTDDLIQKTRSWMVEFGIEQDKVEEFVSAIKTYKQDALNKAAFGGFPANFAFSSGVGGWGSAMKIQPDGSFVFDWHDGDMGDKGPGYNSTMYRSSFKGSFTVVEQVNDKTFKLQLNELKATHAPETSIDSSGLRTIWLDDDAYGLGDPTSSPRQGYTLYLPGIRKSSLPAECQGWLYPREEMLNCYVLVAPDNLTWASVD